MQCLSRLNYIWFLTEEQNERAKKVFGARYKEIIDNLESEKFDYTPIPSSTDYYEGEAKPFNKSGNGFFRVQADLELNDKLRSKE